MAPLAQDTPRHLGWWMLGQALAFLVIWPAFSVWSAGALMAASGVAGGLTPGALRWGSLAAALAMWRELLAVGVLLTAASSAAGLASGARVRSSPWSALAAGCLAAAGAGAALLAGISLELPAALHHPALRFAWALPVWAVQASLGLLMVGAAALAGWSARAVAAAFRRLLALGALAACGWGLAAHLPDGGARRAPAGMRIVLGLDSISRLDAVEPLRALAAEKGGTWYRRAVTPGLITNSVWWSIATGEPPDRTGVFFVFQTPAPERLPPTLVARAHAAGLRTCAFFSDQLTMQLGADVAFDENHSGPRGWLQITTAAVKDASWFLPLLLAHLPSIPGAATPANQGHTYTFSVRRELAEVLSCGAPAGESLTLAHLDYLHQARYPGMSQLRPEERGRVRRAPVSGLVDRSIDWQYPATPGEPLQLYSWKLAHLQASLREVVESTRVLDPGLRNELVILSDHGPRTGLTAENFGTERYYGVILATFGIPPRDPDAPISLLDTGALIGLAPAGSAPRPPLTEYVEAQPPDWGELARGSLPLLDGRVSLPRSALARMGGRLAAYRPYTEPRGYSLAPAVPAQEAEGRALRIPRSGSGRARAAGE
jgi:hypothetical protein